MEKQRRKQNQLHYALRYAARGWRVFPCKIDKTPHIDSRVMPDDANMNFVFTEQDNIIRQRLFVGTKLKYYIFTLTLEANLALPGSSVDDRAGTDLDCNDAGMPTSMCDAEDASQTQTTFTSSLGLDF